MHAYMVEVLRILYKYLFEFVWEMGEYDCECVYDNLRIKINTETHSHYDAQHFLLMMLNFKQEYKNEETWQIFRLLFLTHSKFKMPRHSLSLFSKYVS